MYYNPCVFFLLQTLKMSLASKLKFLQKGEDTQKYSIKELVDPAGYSILSLRRVDTRFNHPAILVEIELENEEKAVTFLPNRFVEELTDEDLKTITEAKSYRLRCLDPSGVSPEVLIWDENDSSFKKRNKKCSKLSKLYQ